MDIKYLPRRHPDFPDKLRHIPDPPKGIYLLGEVAALTASPMLAIVGSRKVTPYGRLVTTQLASQAARHGATVVSGLALGVDGLAHQAVLEVGGRAVAVLASGIDQITPATNYWLAQKIIKQGGAIMSEYPPGATPYKLNFVARNRLVAGLSDGVLITEAAARSGSLHTAGFALDQGKTVMAVPGNINAPLSVGTNQLIKTGSLPVTDIQDVLLALGMEAAPKQLSLINKDPAQAAIIQLIQGGIADGNELLAKSRLSTPAFNQALTLLEITQQVRALGANQWACA